LPSSATAAATEPTKLLGKPSDSFASGAKRSTILCLLLVLLTLVFYNSVARNSFTNFDDNFYILDNAHVRAGLTWDTVKWAFTSFDAANWHPLTWLSHALDCQLFKLNPAGPHYVNVLLHSANAVLLFLLLEWATGLTWQSFMVAALFALHPLNVESVAWAAERKNVLSMLFFLLTLHAYAWYVRRTSLKRYLAVAGLFALGLMAKPEVITLPFVLMLWDYWPLRRMGSFRLNSQSSVLSSRPVLTERTVGPLNDLSLPVPRSFGYLFLEKTPLLLLSAGSAVVTILAQRAGHAVRGASERVRFGNAVVAYVRYIGKAFWPSRLAVVYPHLGRLLTNWEIVASAAVLVAITALVLVYGNSRRYLVVGWFWFLGTLVPVIGIIQVGVAAMADRYAYISYIGLFVCVVWGVAEIARERKIPAAWLALPAILILATLGMVTHRQISYWRTSETLWRHTLSVTERNYLALDGLGYTLAHEGRTEEAIAEFKAAESLHAYAPAKLIELGALEQTNGHVQDAVQEYARALDASEDSKSRSLALGWLGSAFTQMADIPRAKKSYTYALRENPDNTGALVGSGLLGEREGDPAFAVERISHAMKVEPTDVGYLLLAQAYSRAGQSAEARDAIAKGQSMSHNFVQAQQSAAEALAAAGIKNPEPLSEGK
jgi:tetratricopeptide (TPR) repeat protein